MDEPITWGDLIIADAVYVIILLVGFLAAAVLIAIATKWEEWQRRKPDWKNDWEDRP